MSVYVDLLMDCVRNARWKYLESCHLYADTLDELHDFAARLHLKREWFQTHQIPHYDLNANKRRQAVGLGAVEHNWRQAAEFWRAKHWMPSLVDIERQEGGAE